MGTKPNNTKDQAMPTTTAKRAPKLTIKHPVQPSLDAAVGEYGEGFCLDAINRRVAYLRILEGRKLVAKNPAITPAAIEAALADFDPTTDKRSEIRLAAAKKKMAALDPVTRARLLTDLQAE